MSKNRPKQDWVYIWGIGWWDPNDTGVLPFSFRPALGCVGIFIILGLALLGVAVVEWVLPWLPWL